VANDGGGSKSLKMLIRLGAGVINVVPCPQRLRYIQFDVARALWGDEVIDGAVQNAVQVG
jgi:hypothetical protein